MGASLQKGDKVWGKPPFLKECSAVVPPLLKGGRADEYYESAKVGYILNYTAFCLQIYNKAKCFIYPPLIPPLQKGDKMWRV